MDMDDRVVSRNRSDVQPSSSESRPRTRAPRDEISEDRRDETKRAEWDEGTATNELRGHPLNVSLSEGDQIDLPDPPASDIEPEEDWLRSPFAIGRTKATWADEDVDCCTLYRSIASRSKHMHLHFTALVCSHTRAGRVGNMVVLWQSNAAGHSDEGRVATPRLILVLGPFWMVCCFATIPFFLAFSLAAFFCRFGNTPGTGILTSWILVHALLLAALLCACCRDPGIVERHSEPRVDEYGQPYVWSSQAHTYRPSSALYDAECGAVIDGFHHTCPWIGTAVGKRNRFAFTAFVFLAFVVVAFDVVMFLL